MLARASFFPTLAYNVLMERVTARNWWDRIDNQAVVPGGRGPVARDMIDIDSLKH